MFSWLVEPSQSKSKCRRNSHQHHHARNRNEHIAQLPQEVFPTGALSAAPTLPDAAFFRQHAVEQDEPHHTADIHHDNDEYETGDHKRRNQSAQNRRIDLRKTLLQKVAGRPGLLWKIEVAAGDIATTGSHFSSQKSHHRQTSPLPEAKRPQQLPLSVLESERDRIHRGDRQSCTSQNPSRARYCDLLHDASCKGNHDTQEAQDFAGSATIAGSRKLGLGFSSRT